MNLSLQLSPGCKVEMFYLNVEAVNTHRDRPLVSNIACYPQWQGFAPFCHPCSVLLTYHMLHGTSLTKLAQALSG
jgi:hypothetical protein